MSKKGERKTRNASGAASAQPDPAITRAYESTVEGQEPGRADRYIAEILGVLSRSQIKARNAVIEVDGRPAKLSRILKAGERLRIAWRLEPSPELVPEDIPVSVLYEDERVWVIDKAQGMVTHPGHGNRRGTLANALLGRLGSEAAQNPALRGGIVHRLDKDTSGVIIAAKDAEAQAFLSSQFKDRTTRKEYLAVTIGCPAELEGRIEDRLGRDPRNRKRFTSVQEGGKHALTEYRVLESYGSHALVALRPKTGRTHQLRVHLARLGCPILGDPLYGRKDPRLPEASLMLHAYRLRILLPGASEPSTFKAPLPDRFLRILARLKKTRPRGR